MEHLVIPQEKIAAVTRGLNQAFGIAAFEHIRDLTERPGSNRAFRIVVRGSPYLLRINTRAGDMTRHFICMQAAAEAELAPRVRYNSSEDRISITDFVEAVGGRLWRPVATKRRGWDFDYEGLGQFGTFGSDNIRAWTVASDTGYRFPAMRLKPRFSMKADISSGDNPRTNTLGTFNPLFPIGNYFGVLASTGPGPINFIDVHTRVQTQFPHDVSVSTDWVVQWRESVNDGVYAVPGFLIRAAGNSDARFVGHRPGIEVRWQANRHLWFQADYGIFYAGSFLKQTQPGRDLNYWALWAGYKF
jgi:hypothetical protein